MRWGVVSRTIAAMNRLTSHLSKLIVIVAAVAVVGGGTAVAAKLITGKQIKNGTVTGKDLKAKTIGPKHLSAGAVSSLQGPAGEQGPQGEKGDKGEKGETGAAGAAGANGISKALVRSSAPAVNAPNTMESVMPEGATPILPAGKWIITAKAQVNHFGADWKTSCQVLAGADVLDEVHVAGTAAADRSQIVAHAVLDSSEIKLLGFQCTDDNSGTLLAGRTITAVAVDSLF